MSAHKILAPVAGMSDVSARDLFTFCYALVGNSKHAEDLALESFGAELEHEGLKNGTAALYVASMQYALKQVRSRPSPSESESFNRTEDRLFRALSPLQRALVALKSLLRCPLKDRLAILGIHEQDEQRLWRDALLTMSKSL